MNMATAWTGDKRCSFCAKIIKNFIMVPDEL